jgi:flagellar hook assembly protein FlgD
MVLCEQGRAGVAVYNSAGERVKVLREKGHQAVPWEKVEWNGANEKGEPVASGLYLIHLETGRSADTHKVIVVR